MNGKRVVMVTGVSDYWGARVATRLLEEPGLHVIGLDSTRPAREISGLDFIQADARNALLAELLASEGVDTVCHLKFVSRVKPSEAISDLNVGGAMKVMDACAEAGVGRVVIKSSTEVYGAHPTNSAFLSEDTPLRGSRRFGWTRDLLEIEAFCNEFRAQSSEISLSVLRFANIIGPHADTPFSRYLKLPASPKLMGFDPLMQLIHEADAVEALAWAAIRDMNGAFNIGANGPMPLSRILRLLRRPTLPVFHPLAYRASKLLERGQTRSPVHRAPIDWDYLRYPWIGDTSLMQEMGFEPYYTTEEALGDFARSRGRNREKFSEDALSLDESRLRDTLARRQRAREQEAGQA